MKGRFVVVDYGEVIHKRSDPCPPWCHLCPHMRGGVMPYCYGSVCQHDDEYDLLHCTCNPNDPIVAHADLVGRTETLLRLLRDKRRDRRTDRVAVARLLELSRAMRWSADQRGLSQAWDEVQRLARRLESAMAADAVDPVVSSSHETSTRA